MGILGILVAVGLFCVLLYNFAIYALPAAVGLSIGYWAVTTGAGIIGGAIIGLIAGVTIFVIGQAVFASSRSIVVRGLVALLFVVPAIWAGYSIILQVSGIGGTSSPVWRHLFAIFGALVIGGVAFARLVVTSELKIDSTRQPTLPNSG